MSTCCSDGNWSDPHHATILRGNPDVSVGPFMLGKEAVIVGVFIHVFLESHGMAQDLPSLLSHFLGIDTSNLDQGTESVVSQMMGVAIASVKLLDISVFF